MCIKASALKNEMTQGSKVLSYCKSCKTHTKHKVLQTENKCEMVDGEISEYVDICHQILECGCGNISFRIFKYDNFADWPEIELYPKCSEYDHQPKGGVPWELGGIYSETVNAFNSGLVVLCAIGIRATIEGICKQQGVTEGYNWDSSKNDYKKNKSGDYRKFKNLEGKIFGLSEQGCITNAYAKILHELRFLGNDAAHELEEPFKKDLKAAMLIVDNIIENLYVIPQHGKKLSERKRK